MIFINLICVFDNCDFVLYFRTIRVWDYTQVSFVWKLLNNTLFLGQWQGKHFTGQVPILAGHCPMTGQYFKPWHNIFFVINMLNYLLISCCFFIAGFLCSVIRRAYCTNQGSTMESWNPIFSSIRQLGLHHTSVGCKVRWKCDIEELLHYKLLKGFPQLPYVLASAKQ